MGQRDEVCRVRVKLELRVFWGKGAMQVFDAALITVISCVKLSVPPSSSSLSCEVGIRTHYRDGGGGVSRENDGGRGKGAMQVFKEQTRKLRAKVCGHFHVFLNSKSNSCQEGP